MIKHRDILKVLPVCLLAAAYLSPQAHAQSASDQQKQLVPTDGSGKESVYTEGYQSMTKGDWTGAHQEFQQSYQKAPGDPYDQVSLAAADQNIGQLNEAVPLYRTVMATGANVYPAYTTDPSDKGRSLADIARHNLAKAGFDENGNRIAMSQTTMTQTATLSTQPRVYQVYFELGRADLTPDAAGVLHQASQNAMAGGATRITLTGHTDTLGTNALNDRLSDQRAAAVEAELARDGVPRGEMNAHGVGKAGPAVATADQVNEPRNRRVEIREEQALTN